MSPLLTCTPFLLVWSEDPGRCLAVCLRLFDPEDAIVAGVSEESRSFPVSGELTDATAETIVNGLSLSQSLQIGDSFISIIQDRSGQYSLALSDTTKPAMLAQDLSPFCARLRLEPDTQCYLS